MTCREIRERLAAYADGELGIEGAIEVEAHCERCPACRETCLRERSFAKVVGDLYERRAMPEATRTALLRRLRAGDRDRRPFVAAALAASLTLIVSTAALRGLWSSPPPPATVSAAVGIHEAAERGSLRRDLDSSSVPAVNRWLERELPFFAPIRGGEGGAYRLLGASTALLGDEHGAVVEFRRGDQTMSLFLLSPREWQGFGREIRFRGITFREVEVGGHRVIAWSHAPVSYLLVSALERGAGEACSVCHLGADAATIVGFGEAGES